MIIVIAVLEDNIKSDDFGKMVVSHGYDSLSGDKIIMECIPIEDADYITFDEQRGYVIRDDFLTNK